MPHRVRTLWTVVAIICIVAIGASVVSAALRSAAGEGETGEHGDHHESGLTLVEAPGAPPANLLAQTDPLVAAQT